ncbi:MAG TPA: translation initiation factor IF-2, partial [Anaeromyxobacter sp.]
FVLDAVTKSGTDWVITFPTKRFYVGNGTGSAIKLFQKNFNKTAFSCDDVLINIFDREERTVTTPQSFSPPTPGAAPTALCYEANFLTFNNTNVLGSKNSQSLTTGFANGWLDIHLSSGTNLVNYHKLVNTHTVHVFNVTSGAGPSTSTWQISELSQAMGVKASDLIRKLMQGGTMATINQQIDADTAAFIATEFGFTVEKKGFEVEEYIPEVKVDESKLVNRPPVVTVMGHVDHGKTSLLDAIREADVAAGEAGGITQHIGAYSVQTPHGPITFLDTPGHEAFTAMRQRGAQVTDLVVLVVAADDGVMPQTVESIKAAKAAGVTILVAINKIDKPGATPERVMQQLTEHELVAEKWGGTTIMVPVSARTKQGIPELLEYIALQSEVLELKSNPETLAAGRVIEAKLEKGRGPVATVLVEEGTLKVGDALVTGVHHGRVRAMMNERGEQVKDVPPGYPVEVLGLSGVPVAGDEFNVVEDEKAAKEVAEHRAEKARQKELGSVKKATLEDLFAKAKTSGAKVLNVVVKADVQGSAEAVTQAFEKAATKKVGVKVLDSGVGAITESDVLTAVAGNALIVGFNTKPETKVEQIASQQSVKILLFDIIYEAVDKLREEMAGLLDPIIKEKPLGKAEVRALFNIPKIGAIAGSAVTEGLVKRGAHVRVMRDRKVIHSGKVSSLKRLKDDVREVQAGFECGIGVEGYADVKPGDVLEVYELEEIRPSLD